MAGQSAVKKRKGSKGAKSSTTVYAATNESGVVIIYSKKPQARVSYVGDSLTSLSPLTAEKLGLHIKAGQCVPVSLSLAGK